MDADPPEVFCRHFLACHTVWHDPAKPDEYSLGRLVVHLTPATRSFPVVIPRLFIFGQLFGSVGEYAVRVRLVRVEQTGYDEEVEEQIGENGEPLEWRVPRPLVVSGEAYVDSFATPIGKVFIPSAGTYEFQLLCEGIDEPIARERVLART